MPKTIIVRQTYHCTGCTRYLYDGQGNFAERLGYEGDRLTAFCSTPNCTGELYLETDPTKCGALTVIGDEEIEAEIAQMQQLRASKGKQGYGASIINVYRNQRQAEKDAAIATARIKEKK